MMCVVGLVWWLRAGSSLCVYGVFCCYRIAIVVELQPLLENKTVILCIILEVFTATVFPWLLWEMVVCCPPRVSLLRMILVAAELHR